jgi:hypothetical protein
MLLHFERQLGLALTGDIKVNGNGVVNGRKAAGEFYIHDRPDDLYDFAFVHFKNLPGITAKRMESKWVLSGMSSLRGPFFESFQNAKIRGRKIELELQAE